MKPSLLYKEAREIPRELASRRAFPNPKIPRLLITEYSLTEQGLVYILENPEEFNSLDTRKKTPDDDSSSMSINLDDYESARKFLLESNCSRQYLTYLRRLMPNLEAIQRNSANGVQTALRAFLLNSIAYLTLAADVDDRLIAGCKDPRFDLGEFLFRRFIEHELRDMLRVRDLVWFRPARAPPDPWIEPLLVELAKLPGIGKIILEESDNLERDLTSMVQVRGRLRKFRNGMVALTH